MTEKNLVINNRRFVYSGMFSFHDLVTVINNATDEKGYTRAEKRNEEVVTDVGKNIYLELRPTKKKTNYVKLWMKIKINLRTVTQKSQEFEGHKRIFEQGDVEIIFDSWVYTDWEDRWGQGPFTFFMKAFIHKWFYKLPLEVGFTSELTEDTAYTYNKIRRLFKTYRKQDTSFTFEKDVKQSVAQDIQEHTFSHEVEEGDTQLDFEH